MTQEVICVHSCLGGIPPKPARDVSMSVSHHLHFMTSLLRSAVLRPPSPFWFEATFSRRKLFDIYFIPSYHITAVSASCFPDIAARLGFFVCLFVLPLTCRESEL